MRHRKNILFGLVVGSLLCAGIATTTLDARANTSVDSVSFTMNESGELRSAATGLRFTASMSAADYNDLKDTYDTVSFGVVIMPVAYETLHGEITVENVFGENAEYYWATDNGYSVADTSNKHEIIHLESKEVVTDDVVTVKGSIGEIKPAHYDYDFIGVAYVVGEKDGQVPEYRFADFEATSAVNFVEEAQKDTSGHPAAAKVVADYIANYKQVNGVAPKANYTVETYVNDVLTDTQVLEGDLNAVVEVDANADLEVDQDKSTLSGKVMYDGSLVLKAYYNKTTIQSDETYVLETSRGEVEFDATAFNGTVEKLTYAGKTFNAVDGKWVPANDDVIIPTTQLGEDKPAKIETSEAFYEVEVDIYTMIIRDKDDLDAFPDVAKEQTKNADGEVSINLWDGYFVLGADIDYDGAWTPFIDNGALPTGYGGWQFNGFLGVFDGKGHNIDGMSLNATGEAGFITTLNKKGDDVNTGILRNVSFTNVATHSRSGFVVASGNGTVENVYVHTKTRAGYMSGYFFVHGLNGATVRNCFVETAPFTSTNTANAMIGPNAVNGGKATFTNVIAVGVTSDFSAGISCYADYNALLAANVDFSGWDANFWNVSGGTPYPAKLADKVEINATLSAPKVVPGSTLTISGLTKYNRVALTTPIDGVTLSGNTISVANTVAAGTEISVTVSSVRNAAKTATLTATVVAMARETVTLDVRQDVEYNVENRIDLSAHGVEGNVTAASLAHTEKVVNASGANTTTPKTDAISGLTMDGNTIVIPASAFTVNQYGESTLTLTVESDDTIYSVTIPTLLITKKISNPDEMNSWYSLAQAADSADNRASGYFVLDANIDYNGVTFNSPVSQDDLGESWYSIRSSFIFDGRGHTIDNLTIVEKQGTVFGAGLRGAFVRNVNFTNARVTVASSFITAYAINASRLENIYVHLTEMAAPDSDHRVGVLCGGNADTGYKRSSNCIVYFDDTALEGQNNWYGLGFGNYTTGYVVNTFAIGIKNANAGYVGSGVPAAEKKHFKHYASPKDFLDANPVKEVVNENVPAWSNYWTTDADGLPIPKSLAND